MQRSLKNKLTNEISLFYHKKQFSYLIHCISNKSTPLLQKARSSAAGPQCTAVSWLPNIGQAQVFLKLILFPNHVVNICELQVHEPQNLNAVRDLRDVWYKLFLLEINNLGLFGGERSTLHK